MMRVLLVLAVTFLCFSFVRSQGNEECLQNSVAPNVAQRLRNAISGGANFLNLTTKAQVKAALNSILAVAQMMAFEDYGAVIVGTDTKDFYGVAALEQNYWVFDARNEKVFGDAVRRQWVTRPDKLDLDATPDNTVLNFDPTARPWYAAGEGWATYQFAGGFQGAGANGSTYHIAFPGGVVGVDRNFEEQCSVCLESSLAIAVANVMRGPAQLVMDGAPWQSVIQHMLPLFKTLRNAYLPSVLIGTAEGRAYVITNCKTDPSQCMSVSTPWVAQVGVAGLTPVGKVTTFPLSDDGTLGAQTSDLFDFDPRSRPWYNLADGWTTEYQFALGSQATARTFSKSFGKGVIGVDRYKTEPCNGCDSCSAPTTPPTCGGAANAININFANLLSGMR